MVIGFVDRNSGLVVHSLEVAELFLSLYYFEVDQNRRMEGWIKAKISRQLSVKEGEDTTIPEN